MMGATGEGIREGDTGSPSRIAQWNCRSTPNLVTRAAAWYAERMVAKAFTETMKRAASWPMQAQEELAAYAEEIEAGLQGGVYRATDQELDGIDRGLAAAGAGQFATLDEVEAVLAKHRPA